MDKDELKNFQTELKKAKKLLEKANSTLSESYTVLTYDSDFEEFTDQVATVESDVEDSLNYLNETLSSIKTELKKHKD